MRMALTNTFYQLCNFTVKRPKNKKKEKEKCKRGHRPQTCAIFAAFQLLIDLQKYINQIIIFLVNF